MSPLALSSTSSAPSCTWRCARASRWRCSKAVAWRCKGASSVVRSTLPAGCGCCCNSFCAKCGASCACASTTGRRRASTWRVWMLARSQSRCSVALSGGGRRCWRAVSSAMSRSMPQARAATRSGPALGPRSSATIMADSCRFSPCGHLPNSARDTAGSPTSSPRKLTRFRYASRISSLRHCFSSALADQVWPSFCHRLRPPLPAFRSASSRPASCMVRVDAPRVRLCHRLPQAAAATPDQSTPLCS